MNKRSDRKRHAHDHRTSSGQSKSVQASLKPPQEPQDQKGASGPLEGAIRVDDSQIPVPNEVVERESKRWLGIDLVVLLIAGLMLIFIAFIAWQVSVMTGPAKP
jgi:hypothetical protein